MSRPSNLDSNARWLWGGCFAALLVGAFLGWRTIRDRPLLPIGNTVIPQSTYDQLTLTDPFPARPAPSEPPGSLRMWMYRAADMGDAPLAEVVHPVAFDLNTPWVKALLDQKIRSADNAFTLKMRGQISLSARVTHLHLKSDNGYRVRLRGRQGPDARVENWANDVTNDFEFTVTAEPGCYEIEIDFNNVQGDAFFDLWSEAKDIALYPADAAPSPAPNDAPAR